MDESFMELALRLAERGEGRVSPNPLVGAVIVKDGRIIGQGWHERFGGSHAEINAFENALEDTEGAQMYVTLEPCSHYGKTPPCAEAIIRKKIRKVHVGLLDPNPRVSGKGLQMLRDAGIEVELAKGSLKEKCCKINEVFLKYITTGLPFVLYKTAVTLDGKTAAKTGDSKWVSCAESRLMVQRMRSRYSAIMAGIGTVLKDDPRLTARIEGGRNPIRVIVDTGLRIPENANVLRLMEGDRCIVACGIQKTRDKIKRLEERGIEILEIKSGAGGVELRELMRKLGDMEIDSVLLEGGGTLAYSAFQGGLIDKLAVFIAPKIAGGKGAKTAVEGEGVSLMGEAIELYGMEAEKSGSDILITAYCKGGKA